jgi:hypothetical protein
VTTEGEAAVTTTPDMGSSDTLGFVAPLASPAQAIAAQSLRAGAGLTRGVADVFNTPGVAATAVTFAAGIAIAIALTRRRR